MQQSISKSKPNGKGSGRLPRTGGAVHIFLFLLLGVFPLTAGIGYALTYSFGLTGALSQGFTTQYWQKALFMPDLWVSLLLSASVSFMVISLSFMFALLLTVRMRDQLDARLPRFVLQMPLAIPPLVAGFISFQWWSNSGMLARMAFRAGLIRDALQFPELINDMWYIGVTATLFLTTFPFILLLMLDQYQRADIPALSGLAATLGAPESYIRRKVVAPVLLKRMAPTLLMYGVFLLGAYEVPLLLGRQSPAMISVLIGQKFKKFNLDDLPVAYAETVIYALLTMATVMVFWKWNKPAKPVAS